LQSFTEQYLDKIIKLHWTLFFLKDNNYSFWNRFSILFLLYRKKKLGFS
jgi:hypothetical protein